MFQSSVWLRFLEKSPADFQSAGKPRYSLAPRTGPQTERKIVQIRIARPDDIPAIQRLYRELDAHHVGILPQYFQSVDADIRSDASIAEWMSSDDKAYLVAAVKNTIVGFVSIAERMHPAQTMYRTHRYTVIEYAVVAAEHRSQGIGQALFLSVTEWSRARGILAIQVQVWNDNDEAYRFYQQQGFRSITTRMELSLQ